MPVGQAREQRETPHTLAGVDPGREAARGWVTDARRYVLARRALDAIETAALLEPRMPTPPASAPTPAAAATTTPTSR